jgi:D-lactate dehydrogenase
MTGRVGAVPDERLRQLLGAAVPGGVSNRAIDRLAMAHDASHYLLTPQVVVTPTGVPQLAALFTAAARAGAPLTFRSGGTSLSGQAGTDRVLVDTRRHFREITVLDGGARVRVQPGATVRQVNTRLAAHGHKLGPDPASEAACTIGGVVANNSSGMACGTEYNTYRTLESAVLVLPSGTVLNTADADADRQLAQQEPLLHQQLRQLRDRVRSDPASVALIEQQFALKNTMGYGLNAFLDHHDPVEELLHLVVGSEGTLAFVAEATFRTLLVRSHLATGLLVFPDLRRATDALPELVAAGFATVELLDATSLRVAQQDPQADRGLRAIAVDQHAALLVEYQETSAAALADRIGAGADLLHRLPLARPAELSDDPQARAGLWHIRKGLYATVAGNRPSGTTALLEDIAVPVASLAHTCEQLTGLFDRHGYEASVIFGHAKDGNIHFLLNERFDDPALIQRYVAFTEDLVDLVLGQNGTLKAEHGTGRIMAPFVRRQYGDELYDVMVELKNACDPGRLLNPGSILSDDPMAHIAHLKHTPTVEAEVDRCVECGYCEPVCPSRDLTLTPRQRIVLRREQVRAEQAGDHELAAELAADYRYEGIETCAVDGMCQTACPVLIDTGQLVKRLRSSPSRPAAERVANTAARHWPTVTRAASAGLTIADRLPSALIALPSKAFRRVLGDEVIPLWSPDLPAGGHRRSRVDPEPVAGAAQAVYFAACIGSMFGPEPGSAGVSLAFRELCSRAGVRLVTPDRIDALCCGTPWKSKGLTAGYATMAEIVRPILWQASDEGRLPVVVDASSCSEGLRQLVEPGDQSLPGVEVIDAIAFADAELRPRLTVGHRLPSLLLHPTCSSTRLGLDPALRRLAGMIADTLVVPNDWGCCGFAGDRGLLHPELTAAATAAEAAEVRATEVTAYGSTNRTCEIGLTRATGRPYRHILELLEQVTRA